MILRFITLTFIYYYPIKIQLFNKQTIKFIKNKYFIIKKSILMAF